MASGINFNPASRQVGNQTPIQRGPAAQEQQVQNFNDGFQASGLPEAQPVTGNAGVVEFKVTKEQLTSQAFQQTLATLASSGVQVAVTVITGSEAQPEPSHDKGEVTRSEFNQLQTQVNHQGSQLNSLQSQYGNLAGSHKPSPPTYGGD
ncbi:hypothetical protein JST97_15035 [bacterium]|nr:hypothetical protein [bacterium]